MALLLAAAGCDEARAPASSASAAPATVAQPTSHASADAAAQSDASKAQAPGSVERGASAVQNITFDTLKFPLEKNADYQPSLLTPSIEALNGRTVRLRGYILPSFQQSGITQFVLVRDNMQCCFGPGAALYDCVVVEMKPGKSTDFTVRPVAVEGTFELRDFRGPDGKYLAIYHLDGDAVTF
jgi:hypothetical protein